jgi:hypothetical protein
MNVPNMLECSQRILKGEYHCTIDLLFDWFGLEIKTKIFNCHTADSKPVKQEVNSALSIPWFYITQSCKALPGTNTLAGWVHLQARK